jgi:hypothetical protein
MKIRLRIVGPDGKQETNTIEVYNKDIIVCKVPDGFRPQHAEKLKELFRKAFTLEGPNLIIIPKCVDLSIIRAEEENEAGSKS